MILFYNVLSHSIVFMIPSSNGVEIYAPIAETNELLSNISIVYFIPSSGRLPILILSEQPASSPILNK